MNLSAGGILTVDDFACDIDPHESSLNAHLSQLGKSWELRIAAKELCVGYDEEAPDAPLAAPSLYVFFTSDNVVDWRDLSGFHTDIVYREEPTLLPDNPAGAYVGYSLFANNHTIRFGRRERALFEVDWSCEGRESDFEAPTRFATKGVVRFRGVEVSFANEFQLAMKRHFGTRVIDDIQGEEIDRLASAWHPDMQAAEALLAKHFKLEDFGEPQRTDWVVFYPTVDTLQ